MYCYITPFLLVYFLSLHCAVSFLYARTDRMCDSISWHSVLSFRSRNSSPRYIVFVLARYHLCSSYHDLRVTPLGAPVVRVCLTLKRVPTSDIWRCGSTTGFLLSPTTQMRRFLKNKIKGKKSPKPPQPEFSTQIADRPPGFPTEPSITPKGVRSLFYGDRGVV